MMTSQGWVIPLMVPIWVGLRIERWQLKVHGSTFWAAWSKITSVVKVKERTRMFKLGRVRVRRTLLHTISVDLHSRGVDLSRFFYYFFSFYNCFAIFVTISVFLFIFVGCFCWFLFRYWRHLPIHVESELIKHLSRFSSSSFSEFQYQKWLFYIKNAWKCLQIDSKWPKVTQS